MSNSIPLEITLKQKISPFFDVLELDIESYILDSENEASKSKKFLYLQLKKIIHLHGIGNYFKRDLELIPFIELFNELNGLKIYNPKAFKKFSKMLLNSEVSGYYGVRLEIHLAAILLMKKVDYEIQESPDFKINIGENKSCFIECTSRHLSENKTFDIILKTMLDTIGSKKDKQYMTHNTALFVDITNIVNKHPYVMGKGDQNVKMIRDLILVEINKHNIGSILFIYWGLDKKTKEYTSAYTRVDSSKISSELLFFLDSYYKLDYITLDSIIVPSRP